MSWLTEMQSRRYAKKYEESQKKEAYNKVYQAELAKARAKGIQEKARVAAQRQAARETGGGGGILGMIQSRKYVPPEMTVKQKQKLQMFAQEQRMKAEKAKITRQYTPKAPGQKLNIGPLGDLFDNMGRAANSEFGGSPKGKASQSNPLLNEGGGFGGPILDENTGGFGLSALEMEGIITKKAKK
jgi:hypothetical protein